MSLEEQMQTAKELCEADKYHEALKLINTVLEQSPDNGEHWYWKAVIHFDLKQFHEALAAIDRAIELQPDMFSGWKLKLLVLASLGDETELAKCKKEAIERFGEERVKKSLDNL